jgi:hypothetical protein
MPTKLIRKQFLLSKEEDAKLQAEAKRQGMSVSNLTRKLHGLKPLESGGRRTKTKPQYANGSVKKRK